MQNTALVELEEDVDALCYWVTQLGCPPECIPPKDVLRSVLKSVPLELICNIVKSSIAQSQGEQKVRLNIRVKKTKKMNYRINPERNWKNLPYEVRKSLLISKTVRYLRLNEARLRKLGNGTSDCDGFEMYLRLAKKGAVKNP